MAETMQCVVCNSVLPLFQFYANKRERTGFLKRCKACCIEASSQRRAALKLRRDEMDHQALIERFAALSGKSRRETELLLEQRRIQAMLEEQKKKAMSEIEEVVR